MKCLFRFGIRIIIQIEYIALCLLTQKGNNIIQNLESCYCASANEKINILTEFFGYDSKERIPEKIISHMGRKMKRLNNCLCSKKLSFYTNAACFNFEILYSDFILASNMSLIGMAGIDIYIYDDDHHWKGSISPTSIFNLKVKKKIELPKGMKRVDIYLPSYAVVGRMNVSCSKDCVIKQDRHDLVNRKILIYGSSISQGCAASRPGLIYANIINRKINCKVINLGFSESALAQEEIVDYMSKADVWAYVIEYDHNASLTQLYKTHMNLYKKIREKNKEAMIIFISRISGGFSISTDEDNKRVSIIKGTVDEAIRNGDSNVKYICGRDLQIDKESMLADDRHPNDYGMQILANKIVEMLKDEKSM